MWVHNFILTILLLASANSVWAQQLFTPGNLRVITDANGSLVVGTTSQVAPLSQPSIFTNTRLKTDANGALVVTLQGGSFSGVSTLQTTSGNTITLLDNAGTNCPRVNWGPADASHPALDCSGTTLRVRLADGSAFAPLQASTITGTAITATGGLAVNSNTNLSFSGAVLTGGAVPTISSGFGTSPSVPNGTNSESFTINVGTGGTATSGVIALNVTATSGWNCYVTDQTAASGHTGLRTYQTTSTTTTATIESQNSAGAATAWAASSILLVSCVGR